MILQINIGDKLENSERLLRGLSELVEGTPDLLAPAVYEKSRKAAELILEVRQLLQVSKS